MRKLLLTSLFTAAICFAGPASAVMINEWVSNDPGGDDYEFIELCGLPDESLDGLTIVLIEGESTSAGIIDNVIPLTGYAIGASGYFVLGDINVNPDLELAPGWIENGGNNILLVRDFTGAEGDDIDELNDCIADYSIGEIVDGVGYGLGFDALDCITYYGIPGLGPDVNENGSFDPAGGAICDDCDAIGGDWFLICIGGTEPGGECFEADGYFIANATPGAANACSPVPNEPTTWSGVKGLYR
jgi:hypothetical protein